MLTSKQRAFLRGMANGIDAIFQVGKNGVTPELRDTVFNALEARELVKISVLDNNMLGAREAAEMLASRTGAEVVQPESERKEPESCKQRILKYFQRSIIHSFHLFFSVYIFAKSIYRTFVALRFAGVAALTSMKNQTVVSSGPALLRHSFHK